MLTKLRIQNYKSIVDQTIELGRFNVLIGANGVGKSNVLEAVAFLGAIAHRRGDNESLAALGVRIGTHNQMRSAFGEPIERIVFTADVGSQENVVHGVSNGFVWTAGRTYNEQIRAMLSAINEIPRDNEELKEKLTSAFEAAATFQSVLDACLEDVALYAPHEPALRGLTNESKREPIGVHGEDLDMAFSQLSEDIQDKLIGKLSVIPWFDNLEFDERDEGKFKGLKPGRSFSKLYFDDQFMVEGNRRFSAENVNEGILFLLFYMVLFAHPQTPKMLLVDNIEAALNPRLCRSLSKMLAEMAKEHDKQAIVTTHNPAVLDGINLNDPDQRLFVVYRDNDGHTKLERIAEKPKVEVTQRTLKLSEMWMSGLLGGVPNQF